MPHLLLVRHGSWTGEVAPRHDQPLSDLGRKQADEIATEFISYGFQLVVTSPYQRAFLTAKVLADSWRVKMLQDTALEEFFLRDDNSGVETTEAGISRSLCCVWQLLPHWEKVVVVAHNSILTALGKAILNAPWDSGKTFFENPGSHMLLRYDYKLGDDNWRIISRGEPIIQ